MLKRNRLNNFIIDSKITNNFIVRVGEYVNNATKIEFKCLKHSHVWKAIPNNIILANKKGYSGCPLCNKENRRKWSDEKIDEHFKGSFIKRHENSHFINSNTKMSWLYSPYNCEIKDTFGNIYRKYDKDNEFLALSLTNEIIDCKLIRDKRNLIRIGNVEKSTVKVEWKCLDCDSIWHASPSNVIRKTGCPYCFTKNEKKVKKIIEKYKSNFKFYQNHFCIHDCNRKYIVDFYFKQNDGEYIIEYDGIQHFQPIDFFGGKTAFNKQVRRDKFLNEYCQKNMIKLLRLPYTLTTSEIEDSIKSFIQVGGIRQ